MAKDPYRYFRIEARELVDGLAQGIARLEGSPEPAVELERLMRLAHTLKGAAGVVGLAGLMQAAHQLEGLLATHADPAKREGRAPIERLLAVVDGIAAELPRLGEPAPAPAAPGDPAPPSAAALPEAPKAEPLAVESIRLDLLEVDRALVSVADVGARIGAIRAHTSALAALDHDASRIDEWVARMRAPGRAAEATDWEHGALLLARMRSALRAEHDALVAALEGAERRATEAVDDTRRLRLLPAQTLVQELARVARDAAAASDRRVVLDAVGAEVRVDAQVLALLRDALVQIVRNAIAHGIEPPSDRARRGKPEAGRITVRFEHGGTRAIVTCIDDGRGIDVEGVRRALVQRGALDAEAAAELDADALMRVAFQRGVTTRGSANELAGRGVGLQLVGNVVDRLRGEISVRTVPGTSTEIELAVPVSVTAAATLGVVAGDAVATIPLDSVSRTLRIDARSIARAPEGDSILVESGSIRFAPLGRILGTAVSEHDSWSVLLLEAGGAAAAIGVDRIVGVAHEVVRPLPAAAEASAVVSGASLDGLGRPRLALDPRALIDAVCRLAGTVAAGPKAAAKSILVVDDSLTSRMLEQSILEAAGYQVTTATSGEEALLIARRQAFDLFVFDVEMPGMNGFELVARTRAEPALAETPAVLVTSLASPEDKQRGLDAGARAYIVKGEFAQDEFLDAVRRLAG